MTDDLSPVDMEILLENTTRLFNGRPQPRCPMCLSYDHGLIKKSFSQVIICYGCMYKEYYELAWEPSAPTLMDCNDCFSLDSWALPVKNILPPTPTSSPARHIRGPSPLFLACTFSD